MKSIQMVVDRPNQSTELFGICESLIARVGGQQIKVLYCLVNRECDLGHLVQRLHSEHFQIIYFHFSLRV